MSVSYFPGAAAGAAAESIRVVICDDDPDMLLLLRVLLASDPDLDVVGEARDGTEAVALVDGACPDVLVLDIAMPGMSGLEALRHIAAMCPDVRVVLFTGVDRALVPDIAPAYALVEKGAPSEELVHMVKAAAAQRIA